MTQQSEIDSGVKPTHDIVVGYVRGADCDHALEQALEISREPAGGVVHVVRAIGIPDGADLEVLDGAYERARQETIEALTRACERLGQPPRPVHIEVCFGDPASLIAATAERVAASLVIIGHGCDGEVARQLAARLRCALLVSSADRYSNPELLQRQEVARPEDPNRKPHVYSYDNVLEHITHHIGPTRIY